jgi:hypothetical protein
MLFHQPTKYGTDRFRQIFIDHWERWWDYHRESIPTDQRAYVQKIVERMMGCRNPQSGFARYVCPQCYEERIVPFSCKTRFCPSCGKVRTDQWVRQMAQELLDVPHYHLTLTIAKEMRIFFDRDRSLLKVLATEAAAAVREVIAAIYGDIRVGMVYTVHTFGRDLLFKPHVHLVLTAGGLNKDGQWIDFDGIPGGKLAVTWKKRLCDRLSGYHPQNHPLHTVLRRVNRQHRGLQTYTDSFYPKGLQAASYMGRYLGHPPMAMSRLTHYDGQTVRFWFKETMTGQRRDVTLSPLQFISLMVKHIPPKGMQLLRHAGLYARNTKAKWFPKVQQALDALRLQFPLFDLLPLAKSADPIPWRERIKASFGQDPLECPHCQTIMELVEIWEPERRYIWMKRWLETHRRRKEAAAKLRRALATRPLKYKQLSFGFL